MSDFLFGSKPKKAKAEDLTPPEFEALRGPVASQLQSIMQQGGLPAFRGQMVSPLGGSEEALLQMIMQQAGPGAAGTAAQGAVAQQAGGVMNPFAGAAPVTDAEQAGLGQIGGRAFGLDPNQMAGRDLLGQTLQGNFLSPDSNPFLAASIDAAQRPILEQFGDLQQQQRSRFTSAGQFVQPGASSPFDVAEARLTGGVADALGDVGTRMAFQNFKAERQRQMQALGMAEQIPGMDLQRMLQGQDALALPREVAQAGMDRQAGAFEQAGQRQLQAAEMAPGLERSQLEQTLQALEAQALPRLIEQMGLDRGLAEFQRQQQLLLQILGMGVGAASPTAVALPGTPGQTGFIQSLVSGAAQGGAFNP